MFYGVYTGVRDVFGSNGGTGGEASSARRAHGHALDVIGLERRLGLFVEPRLQRWYLGLPHHGFIRAWNLYYASLHFVVPVAALVWLYRAAPGRYRLWRNTLAATTGLALIGFSGYELMPPRLLDASATYGACNPAYHLACHPYGFVDTLARFGGLWSFGSGGMASVSNQYAAMPSLHTAWATWSVLVLWGLVRRRWVRALLVLYPAATVVCIIVTGNHYWIDAAAGLVTLACGYLIARAIDAVTLRRPRSGSTVHVTEPDEVAAPVNGPCR